ncbi:MAG: CPBP family intramembrane glutamic endopeptidase [Methylomonas sp.]
MRLIAHILLPLALLVALVVVATLLGFGILQLTGDILPLGKIISKTTLVLLMLSIFPLKSILGLGWPDFGFTSRSLFFKQMGYGLLLALITLLPVLLMLYALDVHVWDDTRTWTATRIAKKIGIALFFSLLIGVGEETLFRGLLLTGLRRKMGAIAAVTISSLYFAAMHFLKSKTQVAYSEMTITSGFQLMAEAFANWLNPEIINSFISLFVVGVFLAVIRSRIPLGLGLCIGCHAGWVWQIKVSKDLFNVNPQADYLYLISTYDGVVGPLVSVWLAMAIGVWLWVEKARSNSNLGLAKI